eukprot:633798_1
MPSNDYFLCTIPSPLISDGRNSQWMHLRKLVGLQSWHCEMWTGHDKRQCAKPQSLLFYLNQKQRDTRPETHAEEVVRHQKGTTTEKEEPNQTNVVLESPHQQEYAQHRKKNGIQTKDPSTCLMVTHIIVYCLYVQVVMYIYFRAMICTSILLKKK